MGTDTMPRHKNLRLSAPVLLLAVCPVHAEITVTPSLSSAVYAYGIKNQTTDTDRGMAYEIMPSLDLALKGEWLSSKLNLQSQNLSFDDAQRDNQSYFSYDWNSQAKFWQDSLSVTVGARQDNRNVAETTERFRDEINSTTELTTVDSQSAAVSYKNDRFDWAVIDLSINAGRTKANDYIADYQAPATTQGSLENSRFNASFGLNTRDRNRKFFWGVQGDASKTDREVLASQYNRRVNAVVGVPFFWRVSMIATGSVESNSDLEGTQSIFSQYGNYHSLGGGLEWKITDRSWWNVTFNKVTDANEDREYIGTQFELSPSDRTSISGSIDKRFFGRTAQIQGDYKQKHLRMALKVSDTVGSVLGLGNGDLESSLFVCPPGVAPGLDSCFQPPTASYLPAQGESYYNITNPLSDLSEFLVVRREVSYQVGYQFNRLRLAADIGQRKDQLIERNAVNDNKFANLSANWQLNARNSMTLALNYSDLTYEIDGQSGLNEQAGAMQSASLTFEREINRSLSANFNLKQVNVDYRADTLDYQENRVWLGFNYKF